MNKFQRWLIRLTTRFVPQLRRLFEQTGGKLERMQETLEMYREREADRRDVIHSRMEELSEAIAMASGSWMGIEVHEAGKVRESGAVVQLRERLAELELALELAPASGVVAWAACMIIICRLICGYAVRQVTRKIV